MPRASAARARASSKTSSSDLHRAGAGVTALAVGARIEVRATGHAQPVEPIQQRLDELGRERRHDHREGARRLQRAAGRCRPSAISCWGRSPWGVGLTVSAVRTSDVVTAISGRVSVPSILPTVSTRRRHETWRVSQPPPCVPIDTGPQPPVHRDSRPRRRLAASQGDLGREGTAMSASDRVPVSGSERRLTPGHVRVGDVDPGQEIDVTVYVRSRAAVNWVDAEAARPPAARRLVSRGDWADAHGAADEDLRAVTAFAHGAGLNVTGVDAERRAVTLHGTLGGAVTAFRASMEGRFRAGQREYRARTGALTVPAALGDVVTGVFGIDDRPQAPAPPAAAGPRRRRDVVHARAGGRGLRVPGGDHGPGSDRRDRRARRRVQHPGPHHVLPRPRPHARRASPRCRSTEARTRRAPTPTPTQR